MDFSPLYPVSATHQLHFSPGSTFVLSLIGSTLVVRTAADLALVRTWSLASDHPPIDHLAWSHDGSFFLASSSSSGTLEVFVLDPRRQPEQGFILTTEDERRGSTSRLREEVDQSGAVAYIETGAFKSVSAPMWAPPSAPPTILTFGADELGMVAHCLVDASRAVFPDVKKARSYPHPTYRSKMALLHSFGNEGHESIAMYTYQDRASGSAGVTGSYSAIAGRRGDNGAFRNGASQEGFASNWMLESSFRTHTNDAAGLSWAPDGSLVAVWEGPLEYKLHLWTPTGHSRGTLAISSDATLDSAETAFFPPHAEQIDGGREPTAMGSRGPSLRSSTGSGSFRGQNRTASSTQMKDGDEEASQAFVAGGGLGIRTVAWQPLHKRSGVGLLAVGGYDEKVHILTPCTDSAMSGDWSLLSPPLALSQKSQSSSLRSARSFREPRDWVEQTGGSAIVPFHESSLPVNPPAMKTDWDRANPKVGIHWLEWDPTGRFLGVRNESMPSTLFIYVLDGEGSGPTSRMQPQSRTAGPPTSSPVLLTTILFSSTVTSCAWRPLIPQEASKDGIEQMPTAQHRPQMAIVASNTAAVYLWEHLGPSTGEQPTDEHLQRMEGVPIPVSAAFGDSSADGAGPSAYSFRPTSVKYSPDGLKLLLSSSSSSSSSSTVVGAASNGSSATIAIPAPESTEGAYCVGLAVDEGEDEQESYV